MLQNSQIIDSPEDKFSEFLALTVYQDEKYYNNINNYYTNEKKRIYKILKIETLNIYQVKLIIF